MLWCNYHPGSTFRDMIFTTTSPPFTKSCCLMELGLKNKSFQKFLGTRSPSQYECYLWNWGYGVNYFFLEDTGVDKSPLSRQVMSNHCTDWYYIGLVLSLLPRDRISIICVVADSKNNEKGIYIFVNWPNVNRCLLVRHVLQMPFLIVYRQS